MQDIWYIKRSILSKLFDKKRSIFCSASSHIFEHLLPYFWTPPPIFLNPSSHIFETLLPYFWTPPPILMKSSSRHSLPALFSLFLLSSSLIFLSQITCFEFFIILFFLYWQKFCAITPHRTKLFCAITAYCTKPVMGVGNAFILYWLYLNDLFQNSMHCIALQWLMAYAFNIDCSSPDHICQIYIELMLCWC